MKNVRAEQQRAEKVKEKFDFVVSRAVTQMPDFLKWIQKKHQNKNAPMNFKWSAVFKGGDLTKK